MFWFSVQILPKIFFNLRRIQKHFIVNFPRPLYKVSRYPVRFELNFDFLNRFSKNSITSNIVKIRVVGSEMFHADRQTDGWTDGQTDFSNAPTNGHSYWRSGCYSNRKCLCKRYSFWGEPGSGHSVALLTVLVPRVASYLVPTAQEWAAWKLMA